MKTSISSKAFCSITDRQTNKIFTEQMLIYEGNLHKKNGAISQLGAEKITFPPKPDGHTVRQSDRQTDGHLLLQSSFATKNMFLLMHLSTYTRWQIHLFLFLCSQTSKYNIYCILSYVINKLLDINFLRRKIVYLQVFSYPSFLVAKLLYKL